MALGNVELFDRYLTRVGVGEFVEQGPAAAADRSDDVPTLRHELRRYREAEAAGRADKEDGFTFRVGKGGHLASSLMMLPRCGVRSALRQAHGVQSTIASDASLRFRRGLCLLGCRQSI